MAKLRKKDHSTKQFAKYLILFAFEIIEDTYHGTQTHNEYNSFNNGHYAILGSESQRLLLLGIEVEVFGHFV